MKDRNVSKDVESLSSQILDKGMQATDFERWCFNFIRSNTLKNASWRMSRSSKCLKTGDLGH